MVQDDKLQVMMSARVDIKDVASVLEFFTEHKKIPVKSVSDLVRKTFIYVQNIAQQLNPNITISNNHEAINLLYKKEIVTQKIKNRCKMKLNKKEENTNSTFDIDDDIKKLSKEIEKDLEKVEKDL